MGAATPPPDGVGVSPEGRAVCPPPQDESRQVRRLDSHGTTAISGHFAKPLLMGKRKRKRRERRKERKKERKNARDCLC